MAEENPVAKAMAESATHIAISRAETRQRRKWSYIRESELHDWAQKNSVTGSDEAMVRAYFQEPLKLAALQRMPLEEQRKILASGGTPEHFNPNAAVESGVDEAGTNFFAIWSDKGEPTIPPKF